MSNDNLRVTAISNQVYPMLLEMCERSQVDIAELIRELSAKQQLVDIRSGMAQLQSARQ